MTSTPPSAPDDGPTPPAGPTPPGGPRPPAGTTPDPMRRVFQGALRAQVYSTAVITVIALPVGYVVDGWAGLLGALLGAVIALVFTGTTVLSMLVALHRPLSVLAGIILGAWVVKMIVLVAALIVLQGLTFYNRAVLVVVLFAAVLTSMVIDVRAVVRARIPNVDPDAGRARN